MFFSHSSQNLFLFLNLASTLMQTHIRRHTKQLFNGTDLIVQLALFRELRSLTLATYSRHEDWRLNNHPLTYLIPSKAHSLILLSCLVCPRSISSVSCSIQLNSIDRTVYSIVNRPNNSQHEQAFTSYLLLFSNTYMISTVILLQ